MTIVGLVRDGKAATRGDIAELLSIRSTSVSDMVGDLLAKDLLRESMIKPRGRGRPAAALNYNHRRFGAAIISVVERTLVAKAVDLGNRVLDEVRVAPPATADNTAMAAALRDLFERIAARFPADTEICSVVLSLSGLLDSERGLWCFSSRWPRLRNLDVADALRDMGPETVLVRNIDAELAGLRLHEHYQADETVMLLHWGYGIGAAYSANGHIINRRRGRFGEIGHWRLGDGAGRPCTCGNTDCLETVAALWALGGRLREVFPDLPLDETALAKRLSRLDVLRSDAMTEALEQVLRLTTNLCRLLFPDRVVLTGPFVQNPHIYSRFVAALEVAPLLKSSDAISVSAIETGGRYEIAGALHDPFERALRRLAGEPQAVRSHALRA